ncbi:MAG: glycoside hydrolase family 16 protein, partial [Muribaculaceae bacterium]|nr:glycoside hydrolase family 16 protein [Muribaculaceae bacterium]
MNPPAFTIPADLAPGIYRMRYKVDWDNVDPGGAPEGAKGGNILANGGAITDVSLYVHAPGEDFAQMAYSGPGGNYDSPVRGTKDPATGITSVTVNGTTITVASADRYCALRDQVIPVTIGQKLTVNADYVGTASPLKLYFDYGQDGIFASEDASFSDLLGPIEGDASFALHPLTPCGVYRARLIAEDDCVVDFLVNLHNPAVNIDVKAMNGNITTSEGDALPLTISFGSDLRIKAVPVLPGFNASEIIVRHGQNLDGPAYILGNRQWQDTSIPVTAAMIPGYMVDGDIDLYVIYEQSATSEWEKIWGDEFSTSEIDFKRWKFQPRYSATWNRLVAQGDQETPLVNIMADGHYKSYCIPTPDEFKSFESQDMISGALNTQGLFHLTYGRVEARIKTNRHTGNFPAFWMMPMDNPRGWPKDGEIDIWEQIDNEQKTYHTVHTGWTYQSYGSVSQSSPVKSGSAWCDQDLWHVYAIEWDSEQIRWFVDGKEAFTYRNMHFSEGEYTEDVTWPFSKDFYIIINQSVGNGSWAAWCDTSHTYLTEFDWVRVYKKKTDNASTWTTSIDNNGDDPDFYTPGKEDDWTSITDVFMTIDPAIDSMPTEYFDLRGSRLS